MNKRFVVKAGIALAVALIVVLGVREFALRPAPTLLDFSRDGARNEAGDGPDVAAIALARMPVGGAAAAADPVAMPEDKKVPRNAEELAELVAWMRDLPREELLRLTNADFDFEKSELIEMLQHLSGDWVVDALGGMAVAENDPLVKAVLVEGLAGGFSWERIANPRLLPLLDSLMSQLSKSSDDPYEVAGNLPNTALFACAKNGADYVRFVGSHLSGSDNQQFLIKGYLFMGTNGVQGGEVLVQQMLTAHESPDGRLGALEGLRSLASDGRVPSAQLTSLGLSALETEKNERNRMLLYEMMVSAGGEDGLNAVEQIVRNGDANAVTQTVEGLAMKMEPARAMTLFHDLLAQQQLDGEAKQAVYNAMGLVHGEEGANFLLDIAKNPQLDDAERLSGLRALVNRPVDEHLAAEFKDLFETADDSTLRTEALRMMVGGEVENPDLDLRQIGATDDDAAVRAEAVQLAAMQPSEGTRAWLEERLNKDDSLDVKAAALGALVYQAHYTGNGEAVLEYLQQSREFTDDEQALKMIAEGERMVNDYDPRRLELELAQQAHTWQTVAKYTSGPAARGFERQARQLERLVSSLRLASGYLASGDTANR